MGAWGPKLYQDDIAVMIKDYYKDQLRRGKSECAITQELMKQNEYILEDCDDAPIFWFALADTQWKLGRLEEFVREKALYYIQDGRDLSRWQAENSKAAKVREKELCILEQQLLTPQPPVKKISQYKLYHCNWKIGDVYAYRLESDLAKENDLYGCYFLIQKVDEGSCYPGHVIPIVYVKITEPDFLPSNKEEYEKTNYVKVGVTKYEDRFLPIDGRRPEEDIAEKSKLKYEVDDDGFLPRFRVQLLSTSKKAIPNKLIYVGNFSDCMRPPKEFVPHCKLSITDVSWKEFEKKLIERYCMYNLR